ncbi:expressed unknown protein [Seminavis robusta]|uniref:Hint domain-containing protein n=1 Tax=Seminavis robusta TaxID=568900 RepID=A0A9N8H9I3_9STRA|nr:expressed unknown protein [Seminavis robusta]|eukprot:Sro192_g082522.1  (511) ;mRNA; r:59217-60749
MKFVSPFTIITGTIAFMAKSCSSATNCGTPVMIMDNFDGIGAETITMTTGTTFIECTVSCTSAVDLTVFISDGMGNLLSTMTTAEMCGDILQAMTTLASVSLDFDTTTNVNLVFTCTCEDRSAAPSVSAVPSTVPSSAPSEVASMVPSEVASMVPSEVASEVPSSLPSSAPSEVASMVPSEVASEVPSEVPSSLPSTLPSSAPSLVPSTAPSAGPSAAPVPAPSEPPTPSSCFSEQATVHVEQPGQGQVQLSAKMTDLKIGDMILTAKNRFQPIYAFAHNDATTETEFLQIHTTSGKKPLEVTGQHLVYLQGKDSPVTAKSIKVGDSLMEAGQEQGGPAVVAKIETVQRHGIYAPLTQDGTLVVDGFASSCYISLQPNGDPQTMELQGHSTSMMSHHCVAHMLMTLPRLVCIGGINPKWCQTYNNDGVTVFVQMAFDLSDWFHVQHWVVQMFLFAVYLVVLCPLYAMELLFGAKLAAAVVVGGLVFVGSVVHGKNVPAAVDPADLNLKNE